MAGETTLAHGLGWLSLALGVAAVAEPRGVARLIGVPDDDAHRDVLLAVGLREIASGVGILTRPRPTGWLWARAAGDVMDLSLLGMALTGDDSDRGRVAMTTAAILGITAVDFAAAGMLSRSEAQQRNGFGDGVPSRQRGGRARSGGMMDIVKSVTVNRSANDLYRYWRDFRNLPRFMAHLEAVEVSDDGLQSHWRAKGPAGTSVGWDAEMIDDRPGEMIAWRSLNGSEVENSGAVRFVRAPGGRGTEVRVEMHYSPPAGKVGAAVAKLLGEDPEQQVLEDLRHFKQVMEAGEVIRSDGTVTREGLPPKGERPAQPPPAELVGAE